MTTWRRYIQCLAEHPTRPILPWRAHRVLRPWSELTGRIGTVRSYSACEKPGSVETPRRKELFAVTYHESEKGNAWREEGNRIEAGSPAKPKLFRWVLAKDSKGDSDGSVTETDRPEVPTPGNRDAHLAAVDDLAWRKARGFESAAELGSEPQQHTVTVTRRKTRSYADDWYDAMIDLIETSETPASKFQSEVNEETADWEDLSEVSPSTHGHARNLALSEIQEMLSRERERSRRDRLYRFMGNHLAWKRNQQDIEAFGELDTYSISLGRQQAYSAIRGRRDIYHVSLGNLERRRGYGKNSAKSTIFKFEGLSTPFLMHIAALRRRRYSEHPLMMKRYFGLPMLGPEPVLQPLDDRAETWAQEILSGRSTALSIGQDLPQPHRDHLVFENALLWLLYNQPERARRFLNLALKTGRPLPPSYMIAHALELLILHASKVDRKNEPLCVQLTKSIVHLANRPSYDKLWIDGSHMTVLLTSLEPEAALDAFRKIKATNVSISMNTHLHLIHHLNSSYETVADAVHELGCIATRLPLTLNHDVIRSTCFSVLKQLTGHEDGPKLCSEAVAYLVGMGVSLNVRLCNMVMFNAVHAGNAETVFAVYNMLLDNGMRPDPYTFVALLQACRLVPLDGERLKSVINAALHDGVLLISPLVAKNVLEALYKHHTEVQNPDTYQTIFEAYSQLFDTQPVRELEIAPPLVKVVATEVMPVEAPVLRIILRAYLSRRDLDPVKVLQTYLKIRELARNGEPPFWETLGTVHTYRDFMAWFAASTEGFFMALKIVNDMVADLAGTPEFEASSPTQRPRSELETSGVPVDLEKLRTIDDSTSPHVIDIVAQFQQSRLPHTVLTTLHSELCTKFESTRTAVAMHRAEFVFQKLMSHEDGANRPAWLTMLKVYAQYAEPGKISWCIRNMKKEGIWDEEKGNIFDSLYSSELDESSGDAESAQQPHLPGLELDESSGDLQSEPVTRMNRNTAKGAEPLPHVVDALSVLDSENDAGRAAETGDDIRGPRGDPSSAKRGQAGRMNNPSAVRSEPAKQSRPASHTQVVPDAVDALSVLDFEGADEAFRSPRNDPSNAQQRQASKVTKVGRDTSTSTKRSSPATHTQVMPDVVDALSVLDFEGTGDAVQRPRSDPRNTEQGRASQASNAGKERSKRTKRSSPATHTEVMPDVVDALSVLDFEGAGDAVLQGLRGDPSGAEQCQASKADKTRPTGRSRPTTHTQVMRDIVDALSVRDHEGSASQAATGNDIQDPPGDTAGKANNASRERSKAKKRSKPTSDTQVMPDVVDALSVLDFEGSTKP